MTPTALLKHDYFGLLKRVAEAAEELSDGRRVRDRVRVMLQMTLTQILLIWIYFLSLLKSSQYSLATAAVPTGTITCENRSMEFGPAILICSCGDTIGWWP